MRTTRNTSKNTTPKKAVKEMTPSRAVHTEEEKEPKPGPTSDAKTSAHDRRQEIDGETNAHDSEKKKLSSPTNDKASPPEGKEITEMATSAHAEETLADQKKATVKDDSMSVSVEAAIMKDDMEVEEEEEVEEEVDYVGEGEEEEQGEGFANEDEENLEEIEGYNEEEEVEELEEIEVEEEVEVEEEEEEEEDNEGEGEEQLLEQRPVTERQKRKKFEVFVGGLDKDATEDDVRKAFEGVGEVIEIRLMRHPLTGKNKGYAFVRFATVEQAKRAATEFQRTKIRDKECGVVPSEDNDTLFVGNICKSWKKEQVLEKLKEYGVEGIEEVTLMSDSKDEQLNRGYAFLELATHNDAVKAFVRLSKPDAIFGSDRSAKVAWAEPLMDEEVLAQVKSVFIDGMPPSWDESKVKEHFIQYGEIERVVLAKDNPNSKRNDYAFVNYASRESAVACVEALRNGELLDGDSKVKVTVAFSKTLPRKKHINGSRGGYPIGGRPFVRGRGWPSHRGSFGVGRGRSGRGFSRGGRIGYGGGRRPAYDEPRFIRGPRKYIADEKPFHEDRPRIRAPPRDIAPPPRGRAQGPFGRRDEVSYSRKPNYEYSSSRSRGGSSSRRGRGAPHREEYTPRGGRASSGFPRGRGYSSRPPPPRDELYPRRPERGQSYDRNVESRYGAGAPDYRDVGPGMKRSYAAVNDEDVYYDSGRRGYPRSRIDYADPQPVATSRYTDAVRAPLRPSLSRSGMQSGGSGSLPSSSLPIYDQSGSIYASGGHVYPPVMSGTNDYASGAGEFRGGSYSSSMYGSRTGSSYGSGSYY